MKPGIQTSEFWLIAIVVLLVVGGALAEKLPPTEAAVVATVLPALWAYVRQKAKETPSKADDQVIETLAPRKPAKPLHVVKDE